jgi:hypothetical protein
MRRRLVTRQLDLLSGRTPPRRRSRGAGGGGTRLTTFGVVVIGLLIGVLGAKLYFQQHDTGALVPAGGFRSCAEAKAAGVPTMWWWHNGYRPGLDADHDGRACEWNGGLFR